MTDLSEATLEEPIVSIWGIAVQRGKVISVKPTTLLCRPDLYWQAINVMNPWIRKRKKWLKEKKK